MQTQKIEYWKMIIILKELKMKKVIPKNTVLVDLNKLSLIIISTNDPLNQVVSTVSEVGFKIRYKA